MCATVGALVVEAGATEIGAGAIAIGEGSTLVATTAAGTAAATAAGGAFVGAGVGAGITGADVLAGAKTAASIFQGVAAVNSILGAGAARRAASGVLQPAATPTAAPAPVMPTLNSEDVRATQLNELRVISQRQGRASTILTSDAGGGVLGG